MRSLIFSVVLILIILSLVQTRSLENMDSDEERLGKYFIDPPSYSDLLAFLQTRKTNIHKNDDDNKNSNQDVDEIMTRRKEQILSANRRFFFYDFKRPSQHVRPSSSYGRKSHWDTFFG